MIPDEPTDENVKPLLEHLLLCAWPSVDVYGDPHTAFGIRWDDLFIFTDLYEKAEPRPILVPNL